MKKLFPGLSGKNQTRHPWFLAGSGDGPNRHDSGHELEVMANKEVSFKVGQIDHGRSYSLFFSNPYGLRLEITTYDYDIIAS
jgi:hypothetical protein